MAWIIHRFGQRVEADEVFHAGGGIDLDAKRAALLLKTNPVDRHRLLTSLVDQLYRERKRHPGHKAELIAAARLHIAELPTLLPELKRHRELGHASLAAELSARATRRGQTPQEFPPFDPDVTYAIDTFHHLCMVLCEAGDFDAAKAVGRDAVNVGYMTAEALDGWDSLVDKRRARAQRASRV